MKKFFNVVLWTVLTMGVGSWIGKTITMYAAVIFAIIALVVNIAFLSSGAAKKQTKIRMVLIMAGLMAATTVLTMLYSFNKYATEMVVISAIGLIVQWVGGKLAES